MVMKLMKTSEIAKHIGKHRNQVRWLLKKNKIAPIEKLANKYGGITNFYNIESLNHANP